MTAKPLIKVNNLVKIFGDRVILYDIDFDIKDGEIFGIIGSSGAGKTTLLTTLVGLRQPEKGSVLVRSEILNSASRHHEHYTPVTADEVKGIIGFASQYPSIYPELTAIENLLYFASLHGVKGEEARKNAELLLHLMDLEKATDSLAQNLSGGMQRRLDIACALIHHPKILILDEPTADLDPYLRKHIWNLIRRINGQGTTIVISSHHLQDLENYCNRVAIIASGKLKDVGTPNEIKDKYLRTQEIHVQSKPGNYHRIVEDLKDKHIVAFESGDKELVIYTEQPNILLPKILKVLETHHERLEDIRIIKSSLDDVFVKLAVTQ